VQKGGFFSPDVPPTMIDVPVAYNVSTKVVWGEFSTPSLGPKARIGTQVVYDAKKRPTFCAYGKQIRKRDKAEVDDLFKLMRHILATESIYRGKAVKLDVTGINPEEQDGNPQRGMPEFLDLSKIRVEDLTFDSRTQADVEALIFSRLRHADVLRKKGSDLKNGVLLHGIFGTGKSMTASCTAKIATEAGWTYFYIEDARYLEQAYHVAMEYAPSVLFVGDVDKATRGERDEVMDRRLNVLDGIESKGKEVMVIGTTNAPLDVHPAFLRSGRLGIHIEMRPPSAEAAGRLIKLYGGSDLREGIDLLAVGKLLEGNVPATIRDAVDRARMVAVSRDPYAVKLEITEGDIEVAASTIDASKAFFASKGHTPSMLEAIGAVAVDRLGELVQTNGVAKK